MFADDLLLLQFLMIIYLFIIDAIFVDNRICSSNKRNNFDLVFGGFRISLLPSIQFFSEKGMLLAYVNIWSGFFLKSMLMTSLYIMNWAVLGMLDTSLS